MQPNPSVGRRNHRLVMAAFRALWQGGFNKFFKQWFSESGERYYVLFKKNLRVTNIQYGELLSLIVKYRIGRGSPSRLQFQTTEEFRRTIEGVESLFFRDELGRRRALKKSDLSFIATMYQGLLIETVVMGPLFGSCGVYLPPGLRTDWSAICGASGYIHSCGRSVFFRNLLKAREQHLFSALRRHFAAHSGKDSRKRKKMFFVLYAHEDFTDHDRGQAAELRHGLDDVKLYVHKFHMGNRPLVEVLKSLRSRFRSKIVVPEPGNYIEQHKLEDRRNKGIDTERTLWLLIDRSVVPGGHGPGEERYYVCYQQDFINENPFHIFDENKPAWVAHTTIPHTLMAAMINLAWMYAPSDSLLVADPFIGSGTTGLEAIKFSDVSVDGSDNADMADQLAKDNLEFFSLEADGLNRMLNDFSLLRTFLSKSSSARREVEQSFEDVVDRVNHHTNPRDRNDRAEVLKWLIGKSLPTRIMFYTGLKAAVRHLGEIEHGRTSFKNAYLAELQSLMDQMSRLARLLTQQDKSPAGLTAESKGFLQFEGMYSRACSISSRRIRQFAADFVGTTRRIANTDAVVTMKTSTNKYDAIITDPPYGFNTNENPHSLASLYKEMIPAFLQALKDGGQLIMALPEASHTGRQFLFFTQKEMILHQIMVEARKLKMDVVAIGQVGSRPALARPPYYWESERALRRSILHLRFRKRIHGQG